MNVKNFTRLYRERGVLNEIKVNTHKKNMLRFAKEHPVVLVLSADLGTSCEVKEFRKVYTDRYLTMEIAEQNICS